MHRTKLRLVSKSSGDEPPETSPEVDASADALMNGLLSRINARQIKLGIIGLGYVGIPLALVSVRRELQVLGFDINAERVDELNDGRCSIAHIQQSDISIARQRGLFEATTDFARLGEVDAIIICVPTPLTKHQEPDLSYVEATAREIAKTLRRGQLIVLESTTWPGTVDEVMRPILEKTGLRSGIDFFLAFSPEREDPGNDKFETAGIPKIVGGDGPRALELSNALYSVLVTRTVPVSSAATAEAVKLTENIFRAVNIALVNELKIIYAAMGVDIWEVIDAAKTKPFGFMPFYPGPGLGGHCIPIDPFYLTWKAREYGISTRFIELAGQINRSMPRLVVAELVKALDRRFRRGLNGSKILIMGLAYKKNVDDMRESPSLVLIEILEERGALVEFHDPLIPIIPATREHASLAGRKSVPLTADELAKYDAVLISTDHDGVDYATLVRYSKLIVDTRNVIERNGLISDNVVKA